MKKIFNIAVLLFVSVLVYGQSMVMSHSNKVLPYTVTNNLSAFPQVEGYSTYVRSTASTSHYPTMPTGVVAGDLLLAFVSIDNAGSTDVMSINTTVSGENWEIADSLNNSFNNGVLAGIIWKIAEGNGNDTLIVESNTSQESTIIIFRIAGASTLSPIEISKYATTGSITNFNPPSLTPSGGKDKYLWFISAHLDNDVVASAAPSDFGNLISQIGDGVGSASTSVARREYKTGDEYDPGAFTNDTSRGIVFTLIVKPK